MAPQCPGKTTEGDNSSLFTGCREDQGESPREPQGQEVGASSVHSGSCHCLRTARKAGASRLPGETTGRQQPDTTLVLKGVSWSSRLSCPENAISEPNTLLLLFQSRPRRKERSLVGRGGCRPCLSLGSEGPPWPRCELRPSNFGCCLLRGRRARLCLSYALWPPGATAKASPRRGAHAPPRPALTGPCSRPLTAVSALSPQVGQDLDTHWWPWLPILGV